jgi:O-antigen biosynthesis protein WbqP
MKRVFDLIFSVLLILPCILIIILVSPINFLTSSGSVLYWSRRVGKDNKIYMMPKFRSMIEATPLTETHLLDNPDSYLTPVGKFLRLTSLDELPQIFSILKGDMSFVGPRPALFKQKKLITLRSKKGLDKLLPGITGWAQVNGRDELLINEKVEFDLEYLNRKSFWFDMKIILLTILKVFNRENISH